MLHLWLAAVLTISGHVRDQAGAPLPGVTVEVGKSVAISDANGAWRADVAPGSYDVAFRLMNFSTVVRRGVAAPNDRVDASRRARRRRRRRAHAPGRAALDPAARGNDVLIRTATARR